MSKNLQLHKIAPHTYWLDPDSATDRPALGAISGGARTLIVDAGNSSAHARLLLQSLSQERVARLEFLALTHWHWDHVFGAAELNLPAFAHRETRRRIAEMAAWDWSDEALDRRVAEGIEITFCRDMIKAELPDRSGLVLRTPEIAFSDWVEIDLGGVRAQMIHVGGDHGPDNSVVFVPEDRVVFLGDCLGQDIYTGPPGYTTEKLFPLLDTLLALEAEYYLESHNPEPLSRADFERLDAIFRAVGSTVDRLGRDRAAVRASLEARGGGPLDEDTLDILGDFTSEPEAS